MRDLGGFDDPVPLPRHGRTALPQHPTVAEVAAFPIVVQGYRQVPVAAVILQGPATAEELAAFCRGLLGPRTTRMVHILDGFPRNAIGKVLKRELAERFSP